MDDHLRTTHNDSPVGSLTEIAPLEKSQATRVFAAGCLTLLVLFGAWAFADTKEPDIIVTVQSLTGDDINGTLRIDEMKASIADIARDGEVVFRGSLSDAVPFLIERGARPLDVQARGKITVPAHDHVKSTFSHVFQDHLVLHTGKWSVEVIGPKDFEPGGAEQ